MTIAREAILAKHHPDGFNIGVNIGETAGQTVPHLHVHLIPRYSKMSKIPAAECDTSSRRGPTT